MAATSQPRALKETDPVVYLADPLLFGEMEVRKIRRDGRVVCAIDPDSWRPSYELFEREELRLSV